MYDEICFGYIKWFTSNFIVIAQISDIQKHLHTIDQLATVMQTLSRREYPLFRNEYSTASVEIILQKQSDNTTIMSSLDILWMISIQLSKITGDIQSKADFIWKHFKYAKNGNLPRTASRPPIIAMELLTAIKATTANSTDFVCNILFDWFKLKLNFNEWKLTGLQN